MKLNKEYDKMTASTTIVNDIKIANNQIFEDLLKIENELNSIKITEKQEFEPVPQKIYDLSHNFFNYITLNDKNQYIFNDFEYPSKIMLSVGRTYKFNLIKNAPPITFFSLNEDKPVELSGFHNIEKNNEKYYFNNFTLKFNDESEKIIIKSIDDKIYMKDYICLKKNQQPIKYIMSIKFVFSETLDTHIYDTYERTTFESQFKKKMLETFFYNNQTLNIEILTISLNSGIKFTIDITTKNKPTIDFHIKINREKNYQNMKQIENMKDVEKYIQNSREKKEIVIKIKPNYNEQIALVRDTLKLESVEYK